MEKRHICILGNTPTYKEVAEHAIFFKDLLEKKFNRPYVVDRYTDALLFPVIQFIHDVYGVTGRATECHDVMFCYFLHDTGIFLDMDNQDLYIFRNDTISLEKDELYVKVMYNTDMYPNFDLAEMAKE